LKRPSLLTVTGDAILALQSFDPFSSKTLTLLMEELSRRSTRPGLSLAAAGFLGLFATLPGWADPPRFHHAPDSAASLENPLGRNAESALAGRALYAAHCAACHGPDANGGGSAPTLAHGRTQLAADGEVFWFITKGSNSGAMPSWVSLPEQQRWQLVVYLKTLGDEPNGKVRSISPY
jgi:mono/diheme cytochrome c family protein